MADDDMPLSALTMNKGAKNLSDDAPLVNLAAARPKTSRQSGASSGAAPRPSPPKDKAPRTSPLPLKEVAKKDNDDSYSDSDSYSYSYSGSESDSRPKKKGAGNKRKAPVGRKGGGAKAKRGAKKAKPAKDENASEGEGGASEEEVEAGYFKRQTRNLKESLVAEFLCRWWYVLPEWPPDDEELYQTELKKKKLRQVQIEEWEWVDDVDANGRGKVYALTQYRGCYRDAKGGLIDLRPRDSCPCQTELMKKDIGYLYQMLTQAYESQIKELEKSRYDESKLKVELMKSLTRVRAKSHEANAVGR